MKALRITLVFSILLNIVATYFILTEVFVSEDVYPPKKKSVFSKKPKSKYFMGKDLVYDALPDDSKGIVFLGDSHTEHFQLLELLGNCHVKNRGISGDRLRGILKRLDPIIRSKPEKIFIQAGINDLGMRVSKDTIIAQYQRLIDMLHEGTPGSKLYVQSIFPVENKKDRPSTYCNPRVNKTIPQINSFLKANAAKQNYTFIDIYSSLVLDGKLNPEYSFDGIHLTAQGYLLWSDLLKPYLD